MELIFLELQSRDIVGSGILSGYHKDSMANSEKRKRLPMLGNTEPFRPSHKIVSEEGEIGVEGIGVDIPVGALPKGTIIK